MGPCVAGLAPPQRPLGARSAVVVAIGRVRLGYPRQVSVSRVVPVLTVLRLDRAVAEYTSVLGLEVVMHHGWIVTLADPDDPGRQLSLLTKDATASVNPDVSIEVDDVAAAYRRVQDAGLEIVHELTVEDWGVRRFFFRDGAGYVVNVFDHHASDTAEAASADHDDSLPTLSQATELNTYS